MISRRPTCVFSRTHPRRQDGTQRHAVKTLRLVLRGAFGSSRPPAAAFSLLLPRSTSSAPGQRAFLGEEGSSAPCPTWKYLSRYLRKQDFHLCVTQHCFYFASSGELLSIDFYFRSVYSVPTSSTLMMRLCFSGVTALFRASALGFYRKTCPQTPRKARNS